MKDGFYTALATPFDKNGKLCEKSYVKLIEDQITAGAAGFLSMGSMGLLGCVPESEYERIIGVACEAVNGRANLFVGATDNSIARVRDKMEKVNKHPVDGVVLTAPYYLSPPVGELAQFFCCCAEMTDKDFFLYDHPSTTQIKLTLPLVLELCGKIKTLRGIKCGDVKLVRGLLENNEIRSDFLPVLGGIDMYIFAHAYGVRNYMDGLFCCFPATIKRIQDSLDSGREPDAWLGIADMLAARDEMVDHGLWPVFTSAMELLGYEGQYAPDYTPVATETHKDIARIILNKLGEL